MEPTFSDTKPHGAFSALLADQDLTHLERVLQRSLSGDLGGPLLPPSYWRERIAALTRQAHLTPTQIQIVHRLYLCIDLFELERQRKRAADARGETPAEKADDANIAGRRTG